MKFCKIEFMTLTSVNSKMFLGNHQADEWAYINECTFKSLFFVTFVSFFCPNFLYTSCTPIRWLLKLFSVSLPI